MKMIVSQDIYGRKARFDPIKQNTIYNGVPLSDKIEVIKIKKCMQENEAASRRYICITVKYFTAF